MKRDESHDQSLPSALVEFMIVASGLVLLLLLIPIGVFSFTNDFDLFWPWFVSMLIATLVLLSTLLYREHHLRLRLERTFLNNNRLVF